MNIFILHQHPREAARYLCNAHLRSQIRESILMLMSAHLHNGAELPKGLPEPDLEPKHYYHPCTKWVAQHIDHYRWLFRHVQMITILYKEMHGVPHYWAGYLDLLVEEPSFKRTNQDGSTNYACPPPAVVSRDLKPDPDFTPSWDLVVTAYRKYYKRDKAHLHRWSPRPIPDWIDY